MITGEPGIFAIESDVFEYDRRPSLMAMGFFIIHLGSLTYGVRKPNATMLANSFDEVARRLSQRGQHLCGFSDAPCNQIVEAVSQSRYDERYEAAHFWGIERDALNELLASRDLLWAPDGDAAFDDGSHILQFDVGPRVRLIGFKRSGDEIGASAVRDIWIDGEQYYKILQDWISAFRTNWMASES